MKSHYPVALETKQTSEGREMYRVTCGCGAPRCWTYAQDLAPGDWIRHATQTHDIVTRRPLHVEPLNPSTARIMVGALLSRG